MEQKKPRLKETSSKKTRVREEEETPRKTPSKKSSSRRAEPEPEPEPEPEEEEAPAPKKARPGGSGGSSRGGARAGGSGGTKKPSGKSLKKNNMNIFLLVGTVVLVVLGIVMILNRPKSKTTVIRFNPNKNWKTAEAIGTEGLRLYQDGLALREQANGDSSSSKWKEYQAKWQEAEAKLEQGRNLGEEAVALGLCVLLDLSEEDSKSWISRYKSVERFETFDEFLVMNKVIPDAKKNEVIAQWKKNTGGYQDKMGAWQEKLYDINKNIRLSGDE